MITKETYYEVEVCDLTDGWTTIRLTTERLKKLKEEITEILGEEMSNFDYDDIPF